MSQFARCLSFAVLALVFTCASALAQATASINGTVRDESGAVLPGVTITATQAQTGLVRTTVSNETGSYSLPNLPLGPYRLEAMLQGFRGYTQTGILLQVGSNPVVNPTLSLGAISENVQVTATASPVDTRSASVGTVVESQRIVELPLNARQVTQLITLSGLAVQTGSSPGFSMNTGVRIAVAGGNDFGVSYSLDGAPHLNNFDGGGLHLPFPDALQEFRLVTGAQEASGGIRAGASVNAVTKAGTNTFHGNLFEFMRDSRFNAEDFFSHKKDGLKRNQFGGTLGGPLQVDRLFFFVGYQGTTTRQNPLDQTAFVPTAAMLAGDFSAFRSPACNGGRTLPPLGLPFVNNQVNPALLSPAALNIAKTLPQAIDECGTVFWGSPVHQNESQLPIRVDYQANQGHSFFGRYMLTTDNRDIPFDAAGNNVLVTSQPGSNDRAHNLTVGHTWVINSAMVNSFRIMGNDIYAQKPGPKFFSPQDVGINAYTAVPGYLRLIVNGGFSIGSGSFASNTYTKIKNYGFSDEFTVVKGSHQLGFGGHYLWTKSDSVANAWSVGSYQFTGAFTGNAISDFLVGRIAQHRQASENPVKVTQPMIGSYVQDSWKLNRVTLNYGVVWNPFLPMNFYEGDVYNFSRDKFLDGVRSTVIPSAPPGFSYPGDPGFNGKAGVNRHLNSWDPRAGFAWDVAGDGRTSVTAGVGLGHDYIQQQLHLNTSSAAPYRVTVNLPPGVSLDNPWAGYPGGNPFPFVYNPANPQFPIYSSFLPLPADLKPTTELSWNAGIQRQLTRQWFVAATYLGRSVRNQIQGQEQNPALNLGFGPCTLYDATTGGPHFYPVCTNAGNINQRRALNLENPGVALGYITQYTDVGYQDYSGMLLNTRLDLGGYLNFNANYTLSKCEGVPVNNLLNTGANYIHQPYQNNGPDDITLDEGPCPADRRHVFNLTSVLRSGSYEGLLGALASDWTASSVIQMRSGAPINVVAGSDVALNGFTDNAPTQRPNVVPGVDPYGDRDALTGYLNAAAFRQPAPGTLGDLPFNYLSGPRFWQWDQSFSRSFNIGDGRRIELRAEGINIVNHLNPNNPVSALNSAAFGRITSAAGTPRIWQFAVKYSF